MGLSDVHCTGNLFHKLIDQTNRKIDRKLDRSDGDINWWQIDQTGRWMEWHMDCSDGVSYTTRQQGH